MQTGRLRNLREFSRYPSATPELTQIAEYRRSIRRSIRREAGTPALFAMFDSKATEVLCNVDKVGRPTTP